MPSKAVPLVGGFYADDARPWSSQDVCNWIPVLAEQPNTLSPAMYRTPPGLRPYVAVDGAGPVRGARNVEGRLLVVMGNELFQISNTGVAIPRGTIPGVGPVQISHNQQGNSNQVIIVNGSAGYIYDTATLDVTRITDAGYPGAKTVDYLASYFLQVEPSGLFWFHSDLADGFAYNTLDRYESEAKPDRLVAVKSSQLEAVAFNQTTIEFFTNTGAATGTFQSKGIVIETGCASSNGIVELDNSLMWLDNKGVFQRMEGYGARPISTRVLERAIAGYDWSSAIAFVWEDRGHKVAYWTFRDGFTVGYDVTTGLWHRRASYGMNRWRLSCLVNWNGRWIGGDFQSGKLYELDWDYPYDGQDPMVRRAVTGALHNEQRRMSVPSIELVFDTGGPSVDVADFPAQPESPELSGALPDGEAGLLWDGGTYTATSGTPPYTFTSRTGTTWPSGLGPMDSAGEVAADTPSVPGEGVNIVRVTDANGLYDQLTDQFTISTGPLVFARSVDSPSAIILGSILGDDFSYSIDTGLGAPITRMHAAGGRVFVFDGVSAGRVSADNGRTWTAITGIAAGTAVNDMAYGDGVWIMVYQTGTVISRSTDGVAFSDVTVASGTRRCATWGDGAFIVGKTNRGIERSTDGATSFSSFTLPLGTGGFDTSLVEVRSAHYTGELFIAATDARDGIVSSATGADGTWISTPHPFASSTADIMTGGTSRALLASGTETAYSDDPAVSWTMGGAVPAFELQTRIATNANGSYLGNTSNTGPMVFRSVIGTTWDNSVDDDLSVTVVAMDVLP